MKTVGRLIAGVLTFVVTFGIAASTAWAYTYNRNAARDYSNKYSCNSTQCRNSSYVDFGGSDCTNFVSQSLKAGSFPSEKHPYDFWQAEWYYSSKSDYSRSWSLVSDFKKYMVDQRKRAVIKSTTMSAQYTAASTGDVFMYDWGTGDGYSHLSIHPGYGAFADFYDSKNAKRYRSVTSGTGDWLNQHATDRYHAPWNWGYWVQRDSTVRSKMKTVIISFTP